MVAQTQPVGPKEEAQTGEGDEIPVTESHYKFTGTIRGYPVYKNLFDMLYYIANPESKIIFAGPFSSLVAVGEYLKVLTGVEPSSPPPAPDPTPSPPAPIPTSGTPMASSAGMWFVLPLLAAAWYFGYI